MRELHSKLLNGGDSVFQNFCFFVWVSLLSVSESTPPPSLSTQAWLSAVQQWTRWWKWECEECGEKKLRSACSSAYFFFYTCAHLAAVEIPSSGSTEQMWCRPPLCLVGALLTAFRLYKQQVWKSVYWPKGRSDSCRAVVWWGPGVEGAEGCLARCLAHCDHVRTRSY